MSSLHPHVLILAPGAKVGLTRALAEAVAARGGTLSAWEADPHSPAAAFCSRRVAGGPVESAAAARALLDWCRDEGVALVVPTRHGDLPALAEARDAFEARAVHLAVSSPPCVALCLDKAASHAWFGQQGLPVPAQTTVAALAGSALRGVFPLVAKDPRGSGSRGLRLCRTAADLAGLPADWLVQTVAPGNEYTVNAYVDRAGRCLCEIPHERLLVSEGEVVRGRTARVPGLMELARRIAGRLPGARGPLNVQIFWDAAAGTATVIEVNPRFGGGYPLAHRAGGRFTDWLLAEFVDGATLPRLDDWEDDLLVVRYREALFFPHDRA